MQTEADVIIVGAGLAGLVAAGEVVAAGKRVLVIDQEPRQNLGGQAFWSLGGLFFVNSPEQRRLKIKDSHALALEDWFGTAGFDREEDFWPRKWAEAYVDFAAGEKRGWLHAQGMRWFPIVGWAERGGYGAVGHGNSVPRFHLTWGTGPGTIEPFVRKAVDAEKRGMLTFAFRHRVDGLVVEGGTVAGVRGAVLEESAAERGAETSRVETGAFAFRASAVIVASGGIGGNHALVRKNWPERMGDAPKFMVQGVPAHVDGRMLAIGAAAGGRLINEDRMWHYCEGLRNWNPVWARHGIRILPGPSSLWLDPTGKRLPPPLYPGFDNLGTLEHITRSGWPHTWFLLDQQTIRREFSLSGSEQNPDITGKSIRGVLRRITGKGAPAPIEAFKEHGEDFVVRDDLASLVEGMNAISDAPPIALETLRREIEARDRELDNPYGKDSQTAAIRQSRAYLGDRLARTVKPHKLLDERSKPLIAVKLNVLTRKTLGGFETDLQGRVFGGDGAVVPGFYAAGEASGFGGGGVHGYRALEGTFLGGCIFSGRSAGRAVAAAV